VDNLQQAYNGLGAWSSPHDFRCRVNALNDQVNNHSYFTKPFKSLREAWVLAEFARLISAESVRLDLVENSDADGYVKISSECHSVQITGADREGREICAEYKPGPSYRVVTHEAINDVDDVAKALATAIETKIEKRYSTRPMLVVDLNLGVHGPEDEELKLRSRIVALKEQHARHVDGIYVLHQGQLV